MIKKPKITQKDLRQLMKRDISNTSKDKQIASPYIRYSASGNISCIACKCQIKSDILWKAHSISRGHKEAVQVLLSENNAPKINMVKFKRLTKEHSPEIFVPAKKKKLMNSESSSMEMSTLGTNILSYEDSDEEVDESSNSPSKAMPGDSTLTDVTAAKKPVTSKIMSDILPEGFFDDPEEDAWVRETVYIDKAEQEWKSFQKEIREVSVVCEEIADGDDDITAIERDASEVTDQLEKWSKINSIEKDVLNIKSSKVNFEVMDIVESSDEEVDLDTVMDWRSKAFGRKVS